ncbi:MAG: hypothetical protein DRJ18_01915 [Candidatus Methanomethylicota archaeon]|nr:MAG: hypothetical protein DRJ18_01915 [Candidatus Verstraetearchaeota archaeon]
MKKIIKALKNLLLEQAYCPHCKDYVRVKVETRRKGRKIVEIRSCTQCGRIIEEIVKNKV